MKKTVLLIITILVICSGTVSADFNIKVGLDFTGDQEWSYENNYYDVMDSFVVAGEYFVPFNDKLDMGAGVSLQTPRGEAAETVDEDVIFNFISFYSMFKYDVDKLYFTGQFGYNLFNTNEELIPDSDDFNPQGGLYYGIGTGMSFSSNVFGEILYTVNNGSISNNADTVNVRNAQISLMVGFSFE